LVGHSRRLTSWHLGSAKRGHGGTPRDLSLFAAATLPYRIDPDRIEAQLENGVLHLSLPRPEEDKPRRISVGG
jgi:hypothetical protein